MGCADSNIQEELAAPSTPLESADALLPWAWMKATKFILSRPSLPDLPPPPVEILPWLYLSNLHPVRTKIRKLRTELGITHVLSTNAMPAHILEPLQQELAACGVDHMYIPGEDTYSYDMIGNHWEECKIFLQKVQRHPNGKVIVHCSAGVNRSGLIVAAAMMLLDEQRVNDGMTDDGPDQTTLSSVTQRLKSKRGIVLTNASFQKQLCILAEQHDKLGPKPEGYSDEPLPALPPPPTDIPALGFRLNPNNSNSNKNSKEGATERTTNTTQTKKKTRVK